MSHLGSWQSRQRGPDRHQTHDQGVIMTKISVPDMSCGHCKASITEALGPLGAELSFDMQNREIEVSGIEADKALEVLDQIGFPASVK